MDITLFRAHVEGLPPGVLMHSTAGMSGLTSGSPELRKELSRLTNVTTSKRTPIRTSASRRLSASSRSTGKPTGPSSRRRCSDPLSNRPRA